MLVFNHYGDMRFRRRELRNLVKGDNFLLRTRGVCCVDSNDCFGQSGCYALAFHYSKVPNDGSKPSYVRHDHFLYSLDSDNLIGHRCLMYDPLSVRKE